MFGLSINEGFSPGTSPGISPGTSSGISPGISPGTSPGISQKVLPEVLRKPASLQTQGPIMPKKITNFPEDFWNAYDKSEKPPVKNTLDVKNVESFSCLTDF